MIRELWRRIRNREEGITGLETAIILIAFVIVASVFAYVVLSAGLFSSQKAKEAVTAGIQTTMATVEIRGNVVARMVSSEVREIYFTVGIPAAGHPVDFNPPSANVSPLVISYMDADNILPSVNWTLQKLTVINADNLLDHNELFRISVQIPTTGNISIGPYDSFALEIKPPDGPAVNFERTIPGRVTQFVNLY
jgi:flagellin FlaB